MVEREEYPHALQRKDTGGSAISKVVRETTDRTLLDVTLGTLISASIRSFWQQSYIVANVLREQCKGRRSRRNSRLSKRMSSNK